MVTNVIKKNAPRLKAVQLAKITTAGIESVTKNGKQWTVLAYGQLNITTSQEKQGRVDPFAVVARLQQVDGKWLLSKIDTVSSFSSCSILCVIISVASDDRLLSSDARGDVTEMVESLRSEIG